MNIRKILRRTASTLFISAITLLNAVSYAQIYTADEFYSSNIVANQEIAQKSASTDKISLSNQKVDEAWILYNNGDYRGAKKLFEEATNLNPNNEKAYYGLGMAFCQLGKPALSMAIVNFSRAIEIKPNFTDAYYNRGIVYFHLNPEHKAEGKAIADFEKVIELDPNYADAYHQLASVYKHLAVTEKNPKYYDISIQNCNKALEINPNYVNVYILRAWNYHDLKKYQLAIKDFEKAYELNPNYKDAERNIELCRKAMNK